MGEKISDLTGLEHASQLQILWLGGNPISDITPLTQLTRLTQLSLGGSAISDITTLTQLTGLTQLSLGGGAISDITPLAQLTRLALLSLYDIPISDITPLAQLTRLTSLDLMNNAISDISAVAGLTNLHSLTLTDNNISDISAVAGLTNLHSLTLTGNNISDISAVAGLTNLANLDLSNNNISDISAVAGLTNLGTLALGGNNISDISAVAGLTNLEVLTLWGHSISDISVLVGLTNLTILYLGSNNISDISPLVANTGLGEGDELSVTGNPLNYASIYTHIPAIQERGVVTSFDPRTARSIRIVSGDDQQAMPGTALANPFVVEIRDQNGAAFEGVPVTFTIASGGGTLSATSATTDSNGRAESVLTLGPNPGTNTVEVAVPEIQENQSFTVEGVEISNTLAIISGNNQEGVPGKTLENPFVVEVRDQSDKPVSGVEVSFSAVAAVRSAQQLRRRIAMVGRRVSSRWGKIREQTL